MQRRYRMVIAWSNADSAFIVSFPDFQHSPHTHGATYAEAAQAGTEVLDMLMSHYQEHGLELPTPTLFPDNDDETP